MDLQCLLLNLDQSMGPKLLITATTYKGPGLLSGASGPLKFRHVDFFYLLCHGLVSSAAYGLFISSWAVGQAKGARLLHLRLTWWSGQHTRQTLFAYRFPGAAAIRVFRQLLIQKSRGP